MLARFRCRNVSELGGVSRRLAPSVRNIALDSVIINIRSCSTRLDFGFMVDFVIRFVEPYGPDMKLYLDDG